LLSRNRGGLETADVNVDSNNISRSRRQALFLQVTEPGAYPPIINASALLADKGWQVTILSAPSCLLSLRVPSHRRITVETVRERACQAVDKVTYVKYFFEALKLARSIKPCLVYASDRLAAGPALAACYVSGADLLYHEHDSPEADAASLTARVRAWCARSAQTVVFPNTERAAIATTALGLQHERVQVVWNVPRLAELPSLDRVSSENPLVIYYHGNISPALLPEEVLVAVRRFGGRVVLRIVGYESPSANGYLAHLQRIGDSSGDASCIRYEGQISRGALLQNATGAHVGLALAPRNPSNLNERYLAGASNKVFDYMAAGLAVLVAKDAPSHEFYVSRGLARACDTSDPDSIASAFSWFIKNARARQDMATKARLMIESKWNFDTAFAKVMDRIT
jgi:glycosyltransferase involved in cell wall biosynthesis